ncbi:MAG: transaldolase family protein [Desulfobacteraceae bacterium]|jgi:transaldolase
MRPDNLKTKIFLDGGDPGETRSIIGAMGFLDGQTTNPTLIAKNPNVLKRLEKGDYFREEEILENYKSIVNELSQLIPDGSISVEVNANQETTADGMLIQAKKMSSWIPNAHIKFPTTYEGLAAADQAVKEDVRVNMTLCFTQEQAAAVHGATRGATRGSVFVSPFVGRLDGLGYNGMGLIQNIMEMYQKEKSHVETLVASVRNMEHFMFSLHLQADIVTAPFKLLREWADNGMPMPGKDYKYDSSQFNPIPYLEINGKTPWKEMRFKHELIDKGLEAFAKDWTKLTGN